MNTIGIDTNVLLTFRLQRGSDFYRAKKLFQQCSTKKIHIFLPLTVLLEAEWVLRSVYKQPKIEIINFFEELLIIENISLLEKSEMKHILNLFKESKNISFADCVIATQIKNQNYGFLTFDRDLEKIFYAS